MKRFLPLLALAALHSPAHAEVALGVGVGTLGLGAQLTAPLAGPVNLRAVVNGLSQSESFTESGIDYDGQLDLGSVGLIADWYPFRGGFRLSGGLFHNGNELTLDASCKQSCDIDGTSYKSNPANPGRVRGHTDFKSLAPYVGIGWGNALQGGRWYVGADLGVLFQDSPQVSLEASGSFIRQGVIPVVVSTSNAQFQQELRNEERSLQAELEDYQYYPVASLTVGYRF